jgi:hypothetical protein
MKPQMSPRERVLAALRGRPVDKVPLTIYEAKLPQCAVERRLRNAGLCIVNRRFSVFSTTRPNCVSESHSYTEKGRARTRSVIRTPVGELSSVSEPAGFTSWTIEKFFKSREDYKALLFMVKDEVIAPRYDAFVEAERRMGEDVILRAGVGTCPLHMIMIHWMGVEVFAEEWAERRDEILKIEAAMREKLRQVYPVVAASPATHANFGGNEVPEVMGPARYREFCLPLFDECAGHFHRNGKLLGTHMDGNTRAWAADVARCGLDYIEAFTPAPDTDMTLAEALKAWPDKVLWINFPSSVHLSSIEKIQQTTRKLIEAAAGTNRLIIGITEDIPEERWQGNLLAISEVIDEMAATSS